MSGGRRQESPESAPDSPLPAEPSQAAGIGAMMRRCGGTQANGGGSKAGLPLLHAGPDIEYGDCVNSDVPANVSNPGCGDTVSQMRFARGRTRTRAELRCQTQDLQNLVWSPFASVARAS